MEIQSSIYFLFQQLLMTMNIMVTIFQKGQLLLEMCGQYKQLVLWSCTTSTAAATCCFSSIQAIHFRYMTMSNYSHSPIGLPLDSNRFWEAIPEVGNDGPSWCLGAASGFETIFGIDPCSLGHRHTPAILFSSPSGPVHLHPHPWLTALSFVPIPHSLSFLFLIRLPILMGQWFCGFTLHLGPLLFQEQIFSQRLLMPPVVLLENYPVSHFCMPWATPSNSQTGNMVLWSRARTGWHDYL